MSQISAAVLYAEIAALRAEVTGTGQAILAGWQSAGFGRPVPPGIANLALYLALRQRDVRRLQAPLAALGLSSLGRSEAHVGASLAALEATLARLAGKGQPPYPPAQRMERGAQALTRAAAQLFGRVPSGAGHIMATLPSEAATDAGLVRRLVEAGMSCARINCAHDDAAAWRAMAGLVRATAVAVGRDCRILMDIGGPKCRIAKVLGPEKLRVGKGDRFALVGRLANADDADRVVATVTLPEVIEALGEGAEVWVNDGRIGARVVGVTPGRRLLEVTHARARGERLRPEKGLNFPATELRIDPLTARDTADLDVVAELADMVGFSFVQRPEEVVRLHRELACRRPGLPALPMVLKIETRLAVRNLPKLLVQAAARGPAAVMIARGDLAVELGFARLSEVQEEIMWLCEAAHMPVIWATQVLEGLVSDGLPTRGETTDAAMAQRAECVMLNKGPFLAEGVAFLADVLRRMARHQAKKFPLFGPLRSWPTGALGMAASPLAADTTAAAGLPRRPPCNVPRRRRAATAKPVPPRPHSP